MENHTSSPDQQQQQPQEHFLKRIIITLLKKSTSIITPNVSTVTWEEILHFLITKSQLKESDIAASGFDDVLMALHHKATTPLTEDFITTKLQPVDLWVKTQYNSLLNTDVGNMAILLESVNSLFNRHFRMKTTLVRLRIIIAFIEHYYYTSLSPSTIVINPKNEDIRTNDTNDEDVIDREGDDVIPAEREYKEAEDPVAQQLALDFRCKEIFLDLLSFSECRDALKEALSVQLSSTASAVSPSLMKTTIRFILAAQTTSTIAKRYVVLREIACLRSFMNHWLNNREVLSVRIPKTVTVTQSRSISMSFAALTGYRDSTGGVLCDGIIQLSHLAPALLKSHGPLVGKLCIYGNYLFVHYIEHSVFTMWNLDTMKRVRIDKSNIGNSLPNIFEHFFIYNNTEFVIPSRGYCLTKGKLHIYNLLFEQTKRNRKERIPIMEDVDNVESTTTTVNNRNKRLRKEGSIFDWVTTLRLTDDKLTVMKWSTHGIYIIIVYRGGRMCIVNTLTLAGYKTFKLSEIASSFPDQTIEHAGYDILTSDGNHLIVGGCDGIIRVWDIQSRECVFSVNTVTKNVLHGNQQGLSVIAADSTITPVKDKKLVINFIIVHRCIGIVDGIEQCLLYVGFTDRVSVWKVEEATVSTVTNIIDMTWIQDLTATKKDGYITYHVVSEHWLFVGYRCGAVYILDMNTWSCVNTIQTKHKYPVINIKLSQSGGPHVVIVTEQPLTEDEKGNIGSTMKYHVEVWHWEISRRLRYLSFESIFDIPVLIEDGVLFIARSDVRMIPL